MTQSEEVGFAVRVVAWAILFLAGVMLSVPPAIHYYSKWNCYWNPDAFKCMGKQVTWKKNQD